MKCRRAKKLIFDFIDGMIADPDRLTLEQHVGECASCEKLATSLSRSLDLLHRVPPVQPDENFTWKVRLRLSQERNALTDNAKTQRGWIKAWNTRFAFSALSTFVAVIAAGYLMSRPLVTSIAPPVASDGAFEQEATQTQVAHDSGFNLGWLERQRKVSQPSTKPAPQQPFQFGRFGPTLVSTGAGAPAGLPQQTLQGASDQPMIGQNETDSRAVQQLHLEIEQLRAALKQCELDRK